MLRDVKTASQVYTRLKFFLYELIGLSNSIAEKNTTRQTCVVNWFRCYLYISTKNSIITDGYMLLDFI